MVVFGAGLILSTPIDAPLSGWRNVGRSGASRRAGLSAIHEVKVHVTRTVTSAVGITFDKSSEPVYRRAFADRHAFGDGTQSHHCDSGLHRRSQLSTRRLRRKHRCNCRSARIRSK